jgi:uncharacterized membrane protein
MAKHDKLIKQLVFDAFFFAIILLFTLIPNIGYIQIGPSSFQFISVFVIIGAALFGWKRGLLYGFFFGLSSLIKVLITPTGWFDALFIMPWNSILPRMIFGLVSGLVFDLFKKILTRSQFFGAMIPLTLFLTFFHSFIVLTTIYVFNFNAVLTNMNLANTSISQGYVIIVLASLVGIQVIGEMLLSAVMAPILVALIYKQGIVAYNGKEDYITSKKITNKSFKQIFKEELSNIDKE